MKKAFILCLPFIFLIFGCSKPKIIPSSYPNAGNPPEALYAILCKKCQKVSYLTNEQMISEQVICYFCKYKQSMRQAVKDYNVYFSAQVKTDQQQYEEASPQPHEETEEEKTQRQKQHFKTQQEQLLKQQSLETQQQKGRMDELKQQQSLQKQYDQLKVEKLERLQVPAQPAVFIAPDSPAKNSADYERFKEEREKLIEIQKRIQEQLQQQNQEPPSPSLAQQELPQPDVQTPEITIPQIKTPLIDTMDCYIDKDGFMRCKKRQQ